MKLPSFKNQISWCALTLIALLVWGAAAADLRAQVPDDSQSVAAENGPAVSPQPASALTKGVSPRSRRQQLESLILKREAMREAMAPAVKSGAPIPSAPPLEDMPETRLAPGVDVEFPRNPGDLILGLAPGVDVDFPGNPGDLVFGRTGRPPASSNPALGGTWPEPAGANVGDQWYVVGNLWAMFSNDGGMTWTDDSASVRAMGPTDAPASCCDQDVIVDPASRVFFVSTLYGNPENVNARVRIAVHRNPDQAANCVYDFHSTIGGNVNLDFPHLGLTKTFLYVGTAEAGSFGQRAAMWRFDLDAMENCREVIGSQFTWNGSIDGARIWVPAGGTVNGETMYWAHHTPEGRLRLFLWNEDTGIRWVTREVAGSNFNSADCRGGANDKNWNTVDIRGYLTRTTVTAIRNDDGPNEDRRGILVHWNSGDIGTARPQAFIRAALFRDESRNFSLFSQPDIFNPGFCFGYPATTANKRGDVGIALALGGRKGGGGPAVRPAVGIADEFTGGNGVIGNAFFTAVGTHNPDVKYGDYLTIHANEPCENWFGATGYALNGGTDVANVNAVYVEFGRRQSIRCWNGWIGILPKPGM